MRVFFALRDMELEDSDDELMGDFLAYMARWRTCYTGSNGGIKNDRNREERPSELISHKLPERQTELHQPFLSLVLLTNLKARSASWPHWINSFGERL